MDKADYAYKLQKEAQDAAEKTIHQLEEFINEDARLVNIRCDDTTVDQFIET